MVCSLMLDLPHDDTDDRSPDLVNFLDDKEDLEEHEDLVVEDNDDDLVEHSLLRLILLLDTELALRCLFLELYIVSFVLIEKNC